MSDVDSKSVERLQAIMTSLLERQLSESLGCVDAALSRWRGGELGVFETHAELLKHAARAERLADRMARIGLDDAGSLLRDAYDLGLVQREEFREFTGKEPEAVSPSQPMGDEPKVGQFGAGLPAKRELIEELLGAGPVLVHVDARRPDAHVPERFRDDPKLVLRFGYDLRPSIIDLSLDDSAISGTLTFGGVPHRCVLPWQAVYAVVSEVDHKGMVWPDDVPECVVESLSARPSATAEPTSSAEQRADERPAAPEPAKKRGGHLKLVK